MPPPTAARHKRQRQRGKLGRRQADTQQQQQLQRRHRHCGELTHRWRRAGRRIDNRAYLKLDAASASDHWRRGSHHPQRRHR